jgi:hypothetical protein
MWLIYKHHPYRGHCEPERSKSQRFLCQDIIHNPWRSCELFNSSDGISQKIFQRICMKKILSTYHIFVAVTQGTGDDYQRLWVQTVTTVVSWNKFINRYKFSCVFVGQWRVEWLVLCVFVCVCGGGGRWQTTTESFKKPDLLASKCNVTYCVLLNKYNSILAIVTRVLWNKGNRQGSKTARRR